MHQWYSMQSKTGGLQSKKEEEKHRIFCSCLDNSSERTDTMPRYQPHILFGRLILTIKHQGIRQCNQQLIQLVVALDTQSNIHCRMKNDRRFPFRDIRTLLKHSAFNIQINLIVADN